MPLDQDENEDDELLEDETVDDANQEFNAISSRLSTTGDLSRNSRGSLKLNPAPGQGELGSSSMEIVVDKEVDIQEISESETAANQAAPPTPDEPTAPNTDDGDGGEPRYGKKRKK